ncbi:MAG: DUF2783 domain-containing protein [Rhodobacteraceae bacterium]|nr:DUF2783 domain-containing protein [Paracoccaceae bacterium]
MLITKPNFDHTDDFYAALIKAHDGLSKAQSDALNARLLLILSNHIGDQSVLDTALKAASSEKELS